MKDKWISVKDRLPNRNDEFLCFDEDGDTDICWFNLNTKKFEENGRDDHGFYNLGVTHWMELPDPPKEYRLRDELR